METPIIASIIGGTFLLLSTVASGLAAYFTKRTSDSVKDEGRKLSKRLDESTRFTYVEGDHDAHDALTRLTLNEPLKVSVTRFSPRKVQRQKRYFQAVRAKILGTMFEEQNYGRLVRYNRITSLSSQENKESLIEMIEDYRKIGVDNVTIRITADKNDFELLIFEKTKIAALCFHDFSKQDVVHSCIIVSDIEMYANFERLYQKIWSEDILLELDFSLGDKHVEEQLNRLKHLQPIEKAGSLSPIDNIIAEAQKKIDAAKIIQS